MLTGAQLATLLVVAANFTVAGIALDQRHPVGLVNIATALLLLALDSGP